jgi:DNA-binding ferritin-like protein (Dps family)
MAKCDQGYLCRVCGQEVETLCEELSGVYDKETIMEFYRHATAEPFSSVREA